MANMMKRVPVAEQEPKVRARNFEEVCLGYNDTEAKEEAERCLNCKNPKCVVGCPVSIALRIGILSTIPPSSIGIPSTVTILLT